MSKRCDACGRGAKKAVSRSHSKIATLRKQYLNLQVKTINGKRLKLCTNCLKTWNKKGVLPKIKVGA